MPVLKVLQVFPIKGWNRIWNFFFLVQGYKDSSVFVPCALEFVCELLILVHTHHLKQFVLNGSALSYTYHILCSFCSQLSLNVQFTIAISTSGGLGFISVHQPTQLWLSFLFYFHASQVSFKFLMWPKMTLNF